MILPEVLNNTESKHPEVSKTKNGKIMLLSRCALRENKKIMFIKKQKTCGLLSQSKILCVIFHH